MLKLLNENSNNIIMKNVIKLVREKGTLSRVDISEQMVIPQPTLTRIIDKLVKANIFKEAGLGHSTGGRRPILLTFNENCSYTFGVELGRSDVKVALTNMNGHLLSFRMKETDHNGTISDIISSVKEMLADIIEETRVEPSLILGVGVGMPGPLNETEDGLISPPNFYGEKSVPLRAMLEKELNYPVTIDNDANVAALAEKWFGKGIEIDHFAYVMADVGVGSGLIVNNDIYRGMFGEAGEIGHSTIDVFGDKCSCGNYGCLETFVSIPAIIEKLKSRLKVSEKEKSLFEKELEDIKFDDLTHAYRKGSVIVQQLLEETGQYLGVGIANLVSLYAPHSIIIGGKVGVVDPIIIEKVRESIRSRVVGHRGKETNIFSSDMQRGVVLGAAALVIHHTFYAFPARSYSL
jgi:predicted NBD/HSP70 family sugar kinase